MTRKIVFFFKRVKDNYKIFSYKLIIYLLSIYSLIFLEKQLNKTLKI